MEKTIIEKLKKEFKKLNEISEKQFKERFSTSKNEDRWSDLLFKEYHISKARIELLLELLNHN